MSKILYDKLFKFRSSIRLKNNSIYVFYNQQTKTHYKDFRKSFKRILKDNKLPKIRLHDIRHLIATYNINYLKASVESVSNALGHSSINITQRYIIYDRQKALEVIENMFDSV